MLWLRGYTYIAASLIVSYILHQLADQTIWLANLPEQPSTLCIMA